MGVIFFARREHFHNVVDFLRGPAFHHPFFEKSFGKLARLHKRILSDHVEREILISDLLFFENRTGDALNRRFNWAKLRSGPHYNRPSSKTQQRPITLRGVWYDDSEIFYRVLHEGNEAFGGIGKAACSLKQKINRRSIKITQSFGH